MGAGFSLNHHNFEASPPIPCLRDLPEGCVAEVLAYLDPLEISRLAKLNRAFRGAFLSDCVWEPKLPSNYPALVHQVLGGSPENLGKREIYEKLCQTNNLDGGAKGVERLGSSGTFAMRMELLRPGKTSQVSLPDHVLGQHASIFPLI